jgi:DNA-binding FrmR family transcriptional regulator
LENALDGPFRSIGNLVLEFVVLHRNLPSRPGAPAFAQHLFPSQHFKLIYFSLITLYRGRGYAYPVQNIEAGEYVMGHLAATKEELLKRVKRIAGQLQAVERALESDLDCAKTLHLVAATRGAMNGLMEEIIEDHAREHVANPSLSEEERKKGVEELLEAIRRYSK